MAHPSDALSHALTALANDRRRAVGFYGNVAGHPGRSLIPRRLLSDVGFATRTQFSYVAASAANVVRSADTRVVELVALRPYGQVEDYARLSSLAHADRVIHDVPTLGGRGVSRLPAYPTYLMSGDVGPDTVGLAKTTTLLRKQTQARAGGPSHHVLINRRGDTVVSVACDDTTHASPQQRAYSIDVAMETCFVISERAHTARRFELGFELPFHPDQLTALAILVRKLQAAYVLIPNVIGPASLPSGLSYFWTQAELAQVPWRPLNFTSGRWRQLEPPFDYSDTDDAPFFARVTAERPFDLATEVWRSDQAPPPTSAREVARRAIGTTDTAGAESLYLAAYASLAAVDRNIDLSSTPRRQMFVSRATHTQADADASADQAASVTEAAIVLDPATIPVPTATGPHVYDFSTGFWQDTPEPKVF